MLCPEPYGRAISFGLVTVPVNVQSATEDHSVRFHQVHLDDMARVRVRKFCETEDREVTQGEIGKGYEISKDRIITVTDEELRAMPLPTAKAIEIQAFVPVSSIDPLMIAEGYYLQASGQVAAKPYVLLRKALGRSSQVAVAKYAWSGRERLGLLRVRDDAIVLHAMRWPDEIRDPSGLAPGEVELAEDEVVGARALIDSMSRDGIEDAEFAVDRYTEALEKVIEAKQEHRAPPVAPAGGEQEGRVLDLMAALEESVAKAKASRGESGGADVHELPKKKSAAGKTAKKTVRKRGA
uniref:non-homologous end joining protein Ku n=1 Tax=Streptomyces geranii TaxID=2058923 RepID=UPI002FCD81C1